jgi:hypothetical protein
VGDWIVRPTRKSCSIECERLCSDSQIHFR